MILTPILLESLTFAHHPGDPATSALALRRDAGRPVTVPEWRRGSCVDPVDSPVAYSIAQTAAPVVLVRVRRSDPTVTGGRLRAVDPLVADLVGGARRRAARATWGNLLGDVEPVRVTFTDDQPVTVPAVLRTSTLAEGGVDVRDGSWRWQFRADGASEWCDIADTRIRVYAVLDGPTSPWAQLPHDQGNSQLPWTAVLDYACRWARGATTVADAAAAITRAVYELGPDLIEYGCPVLAQTQYSTPDFDCTAFLDRLHGGIGNGRYVNCTDCATIVSTFANILGCSLWQSSMWTLDEAGELIGFSINEMVPIGGGSWRRPCGWTGFYYHEVAWDGDCGVRDAVYDASMLLADDLERSAHLLDPATRQRAGLIPAGLLFGEPGDGGYRDRIASPESRAVCVPQPHTRQRRSVV